MSVRSSDVEHLAVGTPGNGGASGGLGSLGGDVFLLILFLELESGDFSLEVLVLAVDADGLETTIIGNSQPLEAVVEGEVVDLGVALELDESLAEVVIVPDLDAVVGTTAGGDVVTVGGEGQGVDERIVGLDGSVQLEDTGPNFEASVTSDRGVVLVLGGTGVPDSGDPVSVVVVLGDDFALSQVIPDSHLGFRRSGEDLSVVLGETDGVDFLLVTDETFFADSVVSDVPETEGLIPRTGQHE